MTEKILKPSQILTGALFNEPMRVETVRANGPGTWIVGLVGTQSERFRSVTLTPRDIEALAIFDVTSTYDGDGRLLRLGLQAYSLGIAYEFDPYFGLSISRVDPLPHQLEAIYDYLLKLARVRFLLADDAGAGKTIMAGLLIRELKLRGLADRTLIVCPANLTFQWQRELNEKFDEKFKVLKGGEIRDQFGINQWLEQKQVITSLDLAKRSEILPGLRQVHWDLTIVDEAHRMSAFDLEHKTLRYRLGELLRDASDHLLLLTATPHKGDPINFSFFLQLLDQDAYADVRSIREAMNQRRAPFYLRRTKEAMVYFPERRPGHAIGSTKMMNEGIKRSVWQISGGPTSRSYVDVFLKYGVGLIGPGDAGEWKSGRKDEEFNGGFVRRFAGEVKIGDVFLLRTSISKIAAIGLVASDYQYLNQFDDVNGWDLQHTRRVKWCKLPEEYDFGRAIFGGNPSRLSHSWDDEVIKYTRNFLNSPPVHWQTAPLPELPAEEPMLEEVPSYLKGIIAEVQDLAQLYREWQKTGNQPTEDEIVSHFIVPFFRSLGWPPEQIAIKWRDIDVAVFTKPPRIPGNCHLIVEAKRSGSGLEGALSQGKRYLKQIGAACDIIVTDGVRYRMYTFQENDFVPIAYANLTWLKREAVELFSRMKRP